MTRSPARSLTKKNACIGTRSLSMGTLPNTHSSTHLAARPVRRCSCRRAGLVHREHSPAAGLGPGQLRAESGLGQHGPSRGSLVTERELARALLCSVFLFMQHPLRRCGRLELEPQTRPMPPGRHRAGPDEPQRRLTHRAPPLSPLNCTARPPRARRRRGCSLVGGPSAGRRCPQPVPTGAGGAIYTPAGGLGGWAGPRGRPQRPHATAGGGDPLPARGAALPWHRGPRARPACAGPAGRNSSGAGPDEPQRRQARRAPPPLPANYTARPPSARRRRGCSPVGGPSAGRRCPCPLSLSTRCTAFNAAERRFGYRPLPKRVT